MRISIISFLLILSYISSAQPTLRWQDLQDLTLTETTGNNWPVATFPAAAQQKAGQSVVIGGYLIPLDQTDFLFVLSQFPFSACFFCDAAGPETVIELWIRPATLRHYRMDQRVQVQGILTLNADNPDHLYYILDQAEIKR